MSMKRLLSLGKANKPRKLARCTLCGHTQLLHIPAQNLLGEAVLQCPTGVFTAKE
jgi:hypothetical protein